MHCIECERGVDQRFALFHAGGLHVHVHHVGPKAFAREFEAGLRAGRVLKEHVDLGEALKRVVVFDVRAVQINVGLGKIEKRRDFVGGEMFDPQKVAGAKWHGQHPSILRCIGRDAASENPSESLFLVGGCGIYLWRCPA